MIARIPVAHLHGGEATEGLVDEAIVIAFLRVSYILLLQKITRIE